MSFSPAITSSKQILHDKQLDVEDIALSLLLRAPILLVLLTLLLLMLEHDDPALMQLPVLLLPLKDTSFWTPTEMALLPVVVVFERPASLAVLLCLYVAALGLAEKLIGALLGMYEHVGNASKSSCVIGTMFVIHGGPWLPPA